MAVDGTWNISIETPIGTRQATLNIAASGGTLTGTQSADGNTGEIADGKVDGNKVSWKVAITNPMPMTLEFSGTVDGDKIAGNANAGAFGALPFTGTRA
ncbi:MAG TPA: hypothetical protein VEH75_06975 [Xanthobacteraceae bacterium]|nr:hypothetical protein [Xanthobacteraceae bacterium]